MSTTEKIVDSCLLSIGSVYSIANVESILGIIILILQVAWLLTKLITKIYKTVKYGGDLESLNDDVSHIVDVLEGFTNDQNGGDTNADDTEP